MKKILTCIYFLVAVSVSGCSPSASQAEPIRVLFIGNSYTFSNDMPKIFAKMAESAGQEVIVASQAKSGYSLADHSVDQSIQVIIASQQWDYIVLQERSDIPVSQEVREGEMYPQIRQFNELARKNGAQIILFMPWAYQDGFPERGFPDYSSMQGEVALGYSHIAGELELPIAPVGIAWQNALQVDPTLELWGADRRHPSLLGSYLAASVFYAIILEESPAKLTISVARVTGEDASLLREVSAETVFTNPPRGKIP